MAKVLVAVDELGWIMVFANPNNIKPDDVKAKDFYLVNETLPIIEICEYYAQHYQHKDFHKAIHTIDGKWVRAN